jgi:hypothetical protein
MRSLSGILLVYAMSLLLAGTTPVGTGHGAHQNQLLDALIPHVHFIDGQLIEPGARAPITLAEDRPGSPALGGGAGASAASTGISLLRPPPAVRMLLPPITELRKLIAAEPAAPTGRTEAPPDPPPTSWS